MERLHQWVTTVDHKRLGILYILYALVFLVIGGVEATIMRIQLIRPHNDFVSPQVFNRMFTMHGTTMIFFVAMPSVFGFANYLIPLMIGARDMAFPRLNAFSFWMTAFGGLLLYFSFIGGDGLYGAGNAPDVGWFAYAPLTSQTFSPGHSTDFWTLSLLVSGFGSIGTAINIIATILCMRCRGMTLGKMPLLAWLNLTMAGLVILAVSPLTAAQLMLLVDRYLGGHFFDTQAGGSAVMWMHFFWIFGHPEVYVLVIPAFAFASEIIPVFSRKAIFGYPVMVAATVVHRIYQYERLGPPHVHGRHEFGRQHLLRAVDDGHCRSHRDQDLQLARAPCGAEQIHFKTPMLFCIAFLFQFLIAGLTGIMLSAAPFDWQLSGILLRGRALSLCHRGRHSVHALWGLLLLVPEDVRKNVQRGARQTALLALPHRIPSDVRFHAYSGPSRDASPNLHLRAGPGLGHLESDRDHRRIFSGGGCVGFRRQPAVVVLAG